MLVQSIWWSCSHACCAREESSALGLKCSPGLTNIAGILYTTLDLSPSGMQSFRWETILLSVLHVDLNINIWQNPSHRFQDTLNIHRMVIWDIGSSFSPSYLNGGWMLKKEEVMEGLLHIWLSYHTKLFIEQWEAAFLWKQQCICGLWGGEKRTGGIGLYGWAFSILW